MEKRAILSGRILPYLLLLPQMAITIIFFYWPASQAIWQSFLMQDAFGVSTEFVGFENYRLVFEQPEYYRAMITTIIFSTFVAILSLSCALLLASQAEPDGARETDPEHPPDPPAEGASRSGEKL